MLRMQVTGRRTFIIYGLNVMFLHDIPTYAFMNELKISKVGGKVR